MQTLFCTILATVRKYTKNTKHEVCNVFGIHFLSPIQQYVIFYNAQSHKHLKCLKTNCENKNL